MKVHWRYDTVVLLAVGLIAAGPALADFSGDYAVSNWTTTQGGSPPAGGGTVDTSGAPGSITLLGGDSGCDTAPTVPCLLDFTIPAAGSGLVKFHWNYSTQDEDGPGFDVWGYLLDGVFTQLSDNNGADSQSGDASFVAGAGQVFGFRIDCTDCAFGPAQATVSEFSVGGPAPAPEPATPLLLGFALVSLGLLRRRLSNR